MHLLPLSQSTRLLLSPIILFTMHNKSFLSLLLILLLGFSYVLYVSAIPATRTKKLNGDEASVLPYLIRIQGALKLKNSEEMLVDRDEGLIKRRKNIEIEDYEGTGANKDHDPKTPGNG